MRVNVAALYSEEIAKSEVPRRSPAQLARTGFGGCKVFYKNLRRSQMGR
jgi:hypothetical protein